MCIAIVSLFQKLLESFWFMKFIDNVQTYIKNVEESVN